MDFEVLVGYREKKKKKESEKINKYMNFFWESKKLWGTRVTMMPIVIGGPQRKKSQGIENQRENRDRP